MKSKSKTTSNQTSNQTATTTPNAPSWIQRPTENYYERVNALGSAEQPFVSGPSALQQQSFQGASNLGSPRIGGNNVFDLAGMLGMNAGTAGANTAQAQMIDPAAFQVGQTQVGPMSQATARNFTDANFSAYENPYTGAVTDTTIADIDANDARIRAQQAAMQAANGGLRNSNNAVLSSLTEGELSRARAASLANIRSQGFNTAAGLISGDNDRQANVSQFNAGQANQGTLAQAQADASRNQLLAQLQASGLMSNQNAFNQGSQFNAGQQDSALMRQLQAAGLLGNLGTTMGADQRANIGLQADIGGEQRNIQNAQGQSEYARLAMLQGLLGVNPNNFIGQAMVSSGTQSGTGTSKESGFDLAKLWAAANGGG
ncbi:hypothetical protein UFOVP679_64 [uncultured Caudovirales phage]|uniref:Uncharacterized protein n=1 Tax=uncultured Caudovirales phage TaxID=2100421 RepID=A0A6J5NJR5_9CAUD|nr:hypothetical protein UFOVP679_64 [uncultured Caudovirales phage]